MPSTWQTVRVFISFTFIDTNLARSLREGETTETVYKKQTTRPLIALQHLIRPDDPVVNHKGVCVGFVTSCVMVDKTQIGLAYVDREASVPGSRLGIFLLPHKKESQEKPKVDLTFGDRVLVQEEAEVLPRFAGFA